MGGIGSKSPLERRNTIARRSQRRTIHNLKSKVDKIFQDIKKFKGTEEDERYDAIRTELDHTKADLMKKTKELQPQVRNIHDTTLKRIDEALEALHNKLRENQEKADKKQRQLQEKAGNQSSKTETTVLEKDNEEDSDDVNADNEDEEKQVLDNLDSKSEKRKSLQLKFVRVIPEENAAKISTAQVELHNNNVAQTKSPQEKRRSILKVGVPVMPGAMMREMSCRSNNLASRYNNQTSVDTPPEDVLSNVNDMVENLQDIEYQISEFVGKKYGTQYNRIRNQLNQYLVDLNLFNANDDVTLEQVKICKNYVGSCLNFLDEKVVKNAEDDDSVFLPSTPADISDKLSKLTKTTAI